MVFGRVLMRFVVSGVLMISGLGFYAAANAQDTLKSCDGCSLDQMKNTAWLDTNAEEAPFWGYKYYVNRQNGVIAKFVTSKEDGPPGDTCPPGGGVGCQSVVKVFPDVPESEFTDYAFKAQQVWGSQIVIEPGPGVPNNAYEFVQYPQMREVVMAQAHTKSAFLNLVTYAVRGLIDKHLLSLPPKVVSVTLILPDGSRVIAIMDPTTERLSHEPNTVRDAAGNFVPETPAKVAGGIGQTTYYDFTNNPADRFKFVQWVSSLGATVTGPTSSQKMYCTESADNSGAGVNVIITCTAY